MALALSPVCLEDALEPVITLNLPAQSCRSVARRRTPMLMISKGSCVSAETEMNKTPSCLLTLNERAH